MKGAVYALHGARVRLTRRALTAASLLGIDVLFQMRHAGPRPLLVFGLALCLFFLAMSRLRSKPRIQRASLLLGVGVFLYGVGASIWGPGLPLVAVAIWLVMLVTLLEGQAAGLVVGLVNAVALGALYAFRELAAAAPATMASSSPAVVVILAGLLLPLLRFVDELTSATEARALALDDTIAEEMKRDEALRLHRLAQDELRGAQRERTLGRLAGGLAHEINSVLPEIEGWIEVLREEAQRNRSLDEAIVEMRDSVTRAAAVGRRLLYVGGQNLTSARPIDLRRYFERVRPTLLAAAGSRIEMSLEVLDTPPVLADPSELTHALVNLIMNSRDALKGSGQITLTARSASVSDCKVLDNAGAVVSVIDSGPGIPQNIRDRIFEPFFTTKGKKGTGLGLATVKRLVEGSGGAVTVHSAKGVGTSVLLYLPRSEATGEPVDDHPSRRNSMRVVSPDKSGPVVLFVEDQASIRNVFERVIPRAGIRLLLADCVDAALEVLAAHRPDLIWSDAIMPGRPTQDLIEYAQRHEIPIVICSGHVQEELLRRDLRANDIEFVPKPYSAKDLIDRARRAQAGQLRPPALPPEPEPVATTLRSESRLETAEAPPPKGKSERPPPSVVRLKVLLADDDASVRRSLKRGLERLDFEVIEATDGLEAVTVYHERGPFDLVVLDANMPGQDGPSAARVIKRTTPDVPVALCTGLGLEPGEKILGVDEILPKPIALSELAARLRWLSERRQRLVS